MKEHFMHPKNENDSLLPCPFCGSNEVVYIQYEHVAGLRWKVMCCGCVAQIDPGYAQEKGVVRGMWNKRV